MKLRHVKTYAAGSPPSNSSTGSISLEINNSMILLPERPNETSLCSIERVGWFTSGQTDYGLDAQESKTLAF